MKKLLLILLIFPIICACENKKENENVKNCIPRSLSVVTLGMNIEDARHKLDSIGMSCVLGEYGELRADGTIYYDSMYFRHITVFYENNRVVEIQLNNMDFDSYEERFKEMKLLKDRYTEKYKEFETDRDASNDFMLAKLWNDSITSLFIKSTKMSNYFSSMISICEESSENNKTNEDFMK